MNSTTWLIVSFIVGTGLGLLSNIIADLIQPHLERRKKLLASLFVGLLSFSVVSIILSNRAEEALQLPPSVATGELLYYEDGKWVLKDLANATSKIIPLPQDVYQTAWSPDGRKILFSWKEVGKKHYSLYTFNTQEFNISSILSLPDLDIGAPSWSPNGTMITFHVFSDINDIQALGQIYIFNLNTNEIKRLTDKSENARFPSWSPNSAEIVFEDSTEKEKPSRIFTMSLDNTEKTEISENIEGYHRQPIWSPDGKSIAFVSATSDKEDIWTINVVNKEAKKITNTPVGRSSARPVWSPDSRWIAFYSNQEKDKATDNSIGFGNIFITNLERSIIYRVTST